MQMQGDSGRERKGKRIRDDCALGHWIGMDELMGHGRSNATKKACPGPSCFSNMLVHYWHLAPKVVVKETDLRTSFLSRLLWYSSSFTPSGFDRGLENNRDALLECRRRAYAHN